MSSPLRLRDSIPKTIPELILDTWKTDNRVTVFLVEHLPAELWEARVPGAPSRTIRMIAAHLHNGRCMWIKTLGKERGIAAPRNVDRYKVEPEELVSALERSNAGILALLKLGCEQGGSIPPTSTYVWRNLPLDVGHVLGYLIAHEGHHRGQIVLLARQLGYRLPAEVTGGFGSGPDGPARSSRDAPDRPQALSVAEASKGSRGLLTTRLAAVQLYHRWQDLRPSPSFPTPPL